MVSNLETELRRQILDASSDDGKALKEAELACYLARIGRFEEAERIRYQLRLNFGKGENVRISILILVLEGILHFFRNLDPAAQDKFVRAELLSRIFRAHDLQSLTNAWLAHLAFNFCEYEKLDGYIKNCLANLTDTDHYSNCRISLTLGDALIYCGDEKSSRIWYERARRSYSALGDEASIGAITYNRSAIRVANVRLEDISSSISDAVAKSISSEVDSASNWQSLVDLLSLDHLLLLAKAGIDIVRRNYAPALAAIQKMLDENMIPRHHVQYHTALIDRIFCLAATGDFKKALNYLSELDLENIENFSQDDKALMYSQLSRSYSLVGENKLHKIFGDIARKHLEDHKKIILNLHASLPKGISDTSLNEDQLR